MNNIPKNKLLLFVAFLATVAAVSSLLGYDQTTVNQSNSNKPKESATIIDNSPLFPKREQIEIVSKPTTETVTKVLRVIDGDTIVAEVNGQPIHIRLIGIDSPEPNDKRARVACLAQKAKEEAEKLLNGQNIYLEKDSTQGDYDKYNRLLAYVFIGGTNFNKLIIEEGYAYEYTYRLPYKYQIEFKTAQNEAQATQKGLWNPDTCGN